MNIYDILEDFNLIREEADNRRKNTVYLISLILLFAVRMPFWTYVFILIAWIFAFYWISDFNSFFYRILKARLSFPYRFRFPLSLRSCVCPLRGSRSIS